MKLTLDAILDGRASLFQPERGHRFGHETILLAAMVMSSSAKHIVECGAGVGAASIAAGLRYPKARLSLIENNTALVAISRRNLELNAMAQRGQAVELDVTAPAKAFRQAGLDAGCADVVMMNPPFHDPARHRPSPDRERAGAHMSQGLENWLRPARRLLRAKGELALIWRADGLAEVIKTLGRGFGALRICPVHPSPHAPAIRVVISALRDSRTPLSLLPPIILRDEKGTPSARAEALLRQGLTVREALKI